MAATEIFHSVGRRLLNQIFNSTVARPATVYVGLRQLDGVGGHPSDAAAADTLTLNLQEVTTVTTGYARQAVTWNNTHAVEGASGADSVITLDAVTFSFTGAGLPVNGITHAFIATTSDNTGTLIASAPLATTRNVADGDSIQVTFKFTLTQG